MKTGWWCFLLLWVAGKALGQGLSLEVNTHFGRIVKHSEDFDFEIEGNSYGIDLHFQIHTNGKKAWHAAQRYPIFGLDLLFFELGNREVLGQAYGFLPNITLHVLQRKRFKGIFQVGTGIALLSKYFDRLDNPTNSAIGSRWNNVSAFKFGLSYLYSPKWTLNGGIGFTHFSNGASQLPNLGLNIPSLYIGVRYAMRPIDAYAVQTKPTAMERKWGLSMHLSMAFREMLVIGGPRYPIYIASLGGMYHLDRYQRLIVGLEYEFNRGVYEFGLHTGDFDSEREARIRARRWMLFVGDEFLFGDWSVLLQAGTYVGGKAFLQQGAWYSKLGARYYLPAIGSPKTRLYMGVYLKAHGIVAEYIALGMGAAL